MTTITTSPLQIIKTKFLPPTNTKGARVKATTASGKSVTLSWDHALDGALDWGNHEQAAHELIKKMGWGGDWIGGADWSGDCYTFINITRHINQQCVTYANKE